MAEVITVVGGGIIGLTTAFELTERGQRVRVYDPTPGERGTGASYFAGGMLAPMPKCSFSKMRFPAHGFQRECVPFAHAQARRSDGCAHRPRYDRHIGGGE